MDLLLTGASGFLGKNVILGAPAGWRILAVYCNDAGFPEFISRAGKANVTPVRCDLGNPDQVAAVFEEYGREWDSCLFLAAKVDIPWSVRDPRGDLQANVVPLLNVLDAIRAHRFVYFSSGAIYDGLEGEVHPGMPLSPTLPYAISKLTAERYVECYARRKKSIENYLIVRFFGAFGPYEPPHKIYTRLIQAFALEGKTEYTIYGDGLNLIDAMYVADAVAAITAMLTEDRRNDTVDLAGGRPLSIEMLVREVALALGCESVRIRKEGIAHESNRFWGSPGKMREMFGFTPGIDLACGIRLFSKFLESSGTVSAQQRIHS